MLNPFSLLTLTEPRSALTPHLWQGLVCRSPIVPPDRTVREAISLLKGIRIVCDANRDPSHSNKLDFQVRSSCVSIVENGKLIGILTERDIVKLSAERRDLDNLAIRDVMSKNIITLKASNFTDISVAIDLLDRHHIRHLPVVDDRHCLVGIVSHESIQYYLVEAAIARVVQLETEKVELLEHCSMLQRRGFANDLAERVKAQTQQAERESVLREITQRIRKSLDLKTVFETAVREIRQFMGTDRVGVFKFNSDSNFDEGEFIAESVGNGLTSILGVQIHDPDFGAKLAHFYQRGRINTLEDIHTGGLQDYEIKTLAKFQVQANLVIPLLNGQILWGLLCIHHCTGHRSWQESEISFVKQIAEQIGIGIQQATLYEKVQLELEIRWRAEEAIALQLRQQQTLSALAQQIRNSLNVAEILATATKQVKELMMVDRASIFRVSANGHLCAVEEVVSAEYPSTIDRNWDNEYLSNEEFQFYLDGNTNVVFDLKQDPRSASLQAYIDQIGVKSKIVVPILLLFGNSNADGDIETWDEPHLWGLLSVHSCRTHRRWQDGEVQLVQQIADQLALAIHQASLFEKLQQELTEREQAETRLVESNQQLALSNQELARATRLKDEFLASMSHELRTPLNVILGLSESLQDAVFGSINDRQQKSIMTIEKSGKHLLALINDILDLSKMEANKFNLEPIDVSIQSICQNSTLFIKELALKRQIRLNTQLPEQLKYLNIRVDDLRFRQVLINLLRGKHYFGCANRRSTRRRRDGETGGIERRSY
jgi:GAF domain-containing protein/CBS domain-containing protein